MRDWWRFGPEIRVSKFRQAEGRENKPFGRQGAREALDFPTLLLEFHDADLGREGTSRVSIAAGWNGRKQVSECGSVEQIE